MDNWLDAVDTPERRLFEALQKMGRLNKCTVLEYRCRRSGTKECRLATVFKVLDTVYAATPDYKLSRGLNHADTDPVARENRALDGGRHWPGHAFNVTELGRWPGLGLPLNCDHVRTSVPFSEVLEAAEGAVAGSPKIVLVTKPTDSR